MNHERTFSDYESLKPSKNPKPATLSLEEEGRGVQNNSAGGVAPKSIDGTLFPPKLKTFFEKQSKEPKKGTSDQLAPKILDESWLLKRGHSLSFVGLFLFTALVYFRPYEYFPSLFWLSSSAFWVAITTLLIFLPTQLGLEGTLTARPREVNLVLLLLTCGALSIPMAVEPGRSALSFVDFLKVVLMFIVMVNVLRSEKRLKQIWILVLIATCVLSIGAMNDYRLGRLGVQGVRIQGLIGGLFDNPNDLALHLVTMIPVTLALVFSSRNPLSKSMYLICAILITGGVVATFSRGGFLALSFSVSVFMWKLARRSRLLLGIVGAALIGLFILVVPAGYGTRLSTTQDDSAVARLDDLKRSVFLAVRHPVFGVGMDNYILYSNNEKASHNAYTQVASEMGIAATVFYVLFMIAPLKRLRSIEHESADTKSRRRYYYWAIGLQAALVAYLVASFFASVAYLWYVYYLVAYSVCLRRIYQAAIERETAGAHAISAPIFDTNPSKISV